MKKLIVQLANRSLRPFGYSLRRLPRKIHQECDRLFSDDFLKVALPAAEINKRLDRFPKPDFLRSYFSADRAAMLRMTLGQTEEFGVALEGRRILDIGCHCGALLFMIARRWPGAALSGCDVEEGKLEVAEVVCPEATIFKSMLQDLPQRPDYDVVFLMQVLEHLVDPKAAVDRLLALTPPGGHVVITVPDGRQDSFPAMSFSPEYGAYAGHVNFWSLESWRHFFERQAPDATTRTGLLPSGHLIAVLTRT